MFNDKSLTQYYDFYENLIGQYEYPDLFSSIITLYFTEDSFDQELVNSGTETLYPVTVH